MTLLERMLGEQAENTTKKKADIEYISEVEKFNPYHDSLGRFTTASGAKSFTIRTRGGAYQRNLTNRAIEREKKRTANKNYKSKVTGTNHKLPRLNSEQAERDRTDAIGKVEAKAHAIAPFMREGQRAAFNKDFEKYVSETDPKVWSKRAKLSRDDAWYDFKGTTREEAERKRRDFEAKRAEEKRKSEDVRNMRAAMERAKSANTKKAKEYRDYQNELFNKYKDESLNGPEKYNYWSRATDAEKQKLKDLEAALVMRDKNGKWRVAKSDGEFWDDEWEYTGNNREFKKSVSQNAGVDCIIELYKFNPYHDERGRFATSNSHSFFTIHTKDPGKQHWADFAVAREKERYKEKQDALDKEKRTQERKKKKQKQETTNTVNNKSDFKPAKTKKEAVEYAKNNLGFQKVSYGTKLDVDAINSINKVITEIQAKYPEVKGAVQSLCTTRSNVYAAVRTEKSGNMELQIGVNVYGKGVEHVRKMYEREVSLGRSPKNTTFESILWHEYGHVLAVISTKKKLGENNPGGNFNGDIDKQIDFIIKRRAKTTEKIWVSNVSKKYGITNSQLAEKISEYAKTNTGETFAEAFGEVNGSPTPRKEAVSLVKESGWYR